MKRFLDWLRTPRLRNRVGGMAWVKPAGLHSGAERIANSAVKTAAVMPNGFWRIEPPLGYIAQCLQRFPDGTLYQPGEVVIVTGLHDKALEPWKDAGVTLADVTQLYAPRLTTKETT